MKRFITCFATLLLSCQLAACSNHYAGLPTARDFPELAQLLETAPQVRTTRVPVFTADGHPLSIAVHESGAGESTLVFVHGVGSNSGCWRFMRGALADYSLIAIDLPGCGQSDTPDAATMGPEGYSPTALARCTLQALRATLAHRRSARTTFVGHSLGGTVILRMWGDDELRTSYSDVLEPVDSLVLFAPADLRLAELPPPLRRKCTISDVDVALSLCFGQLREACALDALESMAWRSSALREEADGCFNLFTNASRRHALQKMILSAVPNVNGVLDYPAAEAWTSNYRQVTVPCLLVWGSRDPMLPLSMGYLLQHDLPDARLRILSPAKHCLTVEQPRACADLMREFVEHRLGPEPVATLTMHPPLQATPGTPNPAAPGLAAHSVEAPYASP